MFYYSYFEIKFAYEIKVMQEPTWTAVNADLCNSQNSKIWVEIDETL